MYNTIDRPGGIEEKDSIRDAALSDLDIEPTMVGNPTTAQVFDSIGDAIIGAGGPEASGIIVIVMSHGDAGCFQTADGDVQIQDVVTHMCHPDLDGKPKVKFLNLILTPSCSGRKLAPKP
mgnify:CR=1 FL=1